MIAFGDFCDPVQLYMVDVLNTSNSKDESDSRIMVNISITLWYIISLHVMSTYDNIISVHLKLLLYTSTCDQNNHYTVPVLGKNLEEKALLATMQHMTLFCMHYVCMIKYFQLSLQFTAKKYLTDSLDIMCSESD